MSTVTETSAYHHSTGSVADALQRIVDGLRAAGDINIAETHLSVSMQVTCHVGAAPEAERRAGAEVLGAAIAPEIPRIDRTMSDGSVFYHVGAFQPTVGRVALNIYAPMDKPDADAEVQA